MREAGFCIFVREECIEEHRRGSVELLCFFFSLHSIAGDSARCARRSRPATELLRVVFLLKTSKGFKPLQAHFHFGP